MVLHEDESAQLKTYHLSIDQLQLFGHSAAQEFSYIGRTASGDITRSGEIKNLAISPQAATDLGRAFDLLREFLSYVVTNNQDEDASKLMMGPASTSAKLAAIEKAFPASRRRPFSVPVGLKGLNNKPAGEATRTQSRDPDRISVENVENDHIVQFRVRKDAFLTDATGDWKFTVDLSSPPDDKPRLSFTD
jgi:hypothetical protein